MTVSAKMLAHKPGDPAADHDGDDGLTNLIFSV
jgi:hypothetical protein